MAFARLDEFVQTSIGQAVPGALVFVCNQPATVTPPGPLTALFGSSSGGSIANPLVADGNGHVFAYVTPGIYTIIITHPLLGTLVYTDQSFQLGGGTAVNTAFQVPGGAINGTNTIFSLTQTPNPGASLQVFVNGLLQRQGIGLDYTLAGNVITFSFAPTTGDNIQTYFFF